MREIIEVGDTVRVDVANYGQSVGTKGIVAASYGDTLVGVEMDKYPYPKGMGGWAYERSKLTLIRKAKPEQKKEDAPMSKRPRLEDINTCWLLKTRQFGNAAVVTSGDGSRLSLSTAAMLNATNGERGCHTICSFDRFDGFAHIIAAKKYKTQAAALRDLLSNTEPAWDWTEDMDKPKYGPAMKVGERAKVIRDFTAPQYEGKCGVVENASNGTWCLGIRLDDGNFAAADTWEKMPDPAPVEITAADIKAKFGDRVVVKLDGQSIEVK